MSTTTAPETMAAFLEKHGKKPASYAAVTGALDAMKTATVEALKRQRTAVTALEQKVAALEQDIAALKSTAYLKDAGIWRHGTIYAVGDVAQHSGSPWVCVKAHTAEGPTPDHACWRLWVKSVKR